MKLVLDNVWEELLSRWDARPHYLAIAYFSCDEDLSFSSPDVLIVNASDGAIASGQTDASVLQRA